MVHGELRQRSSNIEAKAGKGSSEKVRTQAQLQSTNACTCAAREDISTKQGAEKTMLAREKGLIMIEKDPFAREKCLIEAEKDMSAIEEGQREGPDQGGKGHFGQGEGPYRGPREGGQEQDEEQGAWLQQGQRQDQGGQG